jgi:hypothetical protein
MLRVAAMMVVAAASMVSRAPAAMMDWSEVCYPDEGCGLSMPQWTAYCEVLSCSGPMACWNNGNEACSPSYIFIDCNYEMS